MAQVPTIRTVCSTKDYAHAAIVAWRFVYKGALPTKEQVGVLYAQWMVETGGKHCWNWNIGNVKVTPGQVDAGIPWFDLPGTWEIIGGKRVVLGEGDPGRRFRAYASLDDGMAEHMTFLRNRRYASSWSAVEAGDPDRFARLLKAAGYYTAPADQYAAIMVGAHKQWMRSDAFEKALKDVVEASEAETQPDLDVYVSEGPQPIVHSLHLAGLPGVGEDDPPDAA